MISIDKFNNKKDYGMVYLVFDGRYFKIGRTLDIERRIKEIKTSNPSAKLVATHLVDYHRDYETKLHLMFSKYRCHNEWFQFNEIESFNDLTLLWFMFSNYMYDFSEVSSNSYNIPVDVIEYIKKINETKLSKIEEFSYCEKKEFNYKWLKKTLKNEMEIDPDNFM